jgi:hypothetical protein
LFGIAAGACKWRQFLPPKLTYISIGLYGFACNVIAFFTSVTNCYNADGMLKKAFMISPKERISWQIMQTVEFIGAGIGHRPNP